MFLLHLVPGRSGDKSFAEGNESTAQASTLRQPVIGPGSGVVASIEFMGIHPGIHLPLSLANS